LEQLIVCQSPSLASFAPSRIEWKSPLAPEYREYRDGSFLEVLGLLDRLQNLLARFWPNGGPRWDALALVHREEAQNGVLLVEAKAHTAETQSTCEATNGTSCDQIQLALAQVRGYMGVPQDTADWRKDVYQLANRVAFLYFLNVVANVPTWLVLVNFISDPTHKATSLDEWRQHYSKVFRRMGIHPGCRLLDRIIPVFLDVDDPDLVPIGPEGYTIERRG
jgi:hypothetical protein